MKVFFSSCHLSQSQLSNNISSNVNVLCQLLCRQINDSKNETNDEEKSDIIEITYVNCGVDMLCCDRAEYAEILVRGDEPFDHVGDIDICCKKCDKQKRRGSFKLLEALLLHVTPIVSQVAAFTRLLHPSSTLIVWRDMYICVGHLISLLVCVCC